MPGYYSPEFVYLDWLLQLVLYQRNFCLQHRPLLDVQFSKQKNYVQQKQEQGYIFFALPTEGE
jgi:hypothetical protein